MLSPISDSRTTNFLLFVFGPPMLCRNRFVTSRCNQFIGHFTVDSLDLWKTVSVEQPVVSSNSHADHSNRFCDVYRSTESLKCHLCLWSVFELLGLRLRAAAVHRGLHREQSICLTNSFVFTSLKM